MTVFKRPKQRGCIEKEQSNIRTRVQTEEGCGPKANISSAAVRRNFVTLESGSGSVQQKGCRIGHLLIKINGGLGDVGCITAESLPHF